MNGKSTAALMHEQDVETTVELVGVLTAISLVSRRLAKKLALLERSAGKVGETDAKRQRMSAPAD